MHKYFCSMVIIFTIIISRHVCAQENTVVAFDENNQQLPIFFNNATNSFEIKTQTKYAEHVLALTGYSAASIILFRILLFLDKITTMSSKTDKNFNSIINRAEGHRKLTCLALALTLSGLVRKIRNGPKISRKIIVARGQIQS